MFSFEFIVMTVILISITGYLYVTKKSLNTSEPIDSVVGRLINVSVISIIYSAVIVLRAIMFNDLLGISSIHKEVIWASLLCLAIFILMGSVIVWTKIKTDCQTRIKIPFLMLVLGLGLITPLNGFTLFYYLVVIAYLTVASGFVLEVAKTPELKTNNGIYYIAGASIILFIATIFSIYSSFMYFNIFILAIESLLIFGICIFFADYFIRTLARKNDALTRRDDIITKKSEQIGMIAFTDDITDLNNRMALERDLAMVDHPVYMAMIDIRHFMSYNNLLGFNRGNRLLKAMAVNLKSCNVDRVVYYRFYADKFIVRFDTDDKELVKKRLSHICDRLSRDTFHGMDIELKVGLAIYEPNPDCVCIECINETIKKLEISLLVAKSRNLFYHEYKSEDSKHFEEIYNLELQLKQAIHHEQFAMYYQAQVDANTHQIRSLEALIRWELEGRFIPPDHFISLAEKKGLMRPITEFVIDRVYQDISCNPVMKHYQIAINLSADQLVECDFVDFVLQKQKQYDIDASMIIFEITEMSLFNNVEKVKKTIADLKQNGYQISLDDFGNGYSSLLRFSHLEIDEVKFDKAFIDTLNNKRTFNTLQKSSELFKGFGMRIVMEGVEASEHVDLLKQLPIDVYQGYYFYKPKPLAEILEAL